MGSYGDERKKKPVKVLSLFDGISCGMVALERARIPVDRYVAYEIEPNAIKISRKNYPQIKHCGDVTVADFTQYRGFDLLLGGSPCQDLSNYKYDRGDVKGLEGSKSNLFYHFVRALKESEPKYFLLENVASMEQRWVDVISKELGVRPIMINSDLVSAQLRKRLYWTNIPNVTQPTDKGIVLRDIAVLTDEVPDKYWYHREFTYNGPDAKVQATLLGSGLMRNMRECYNLNGKCNTLLCDGDGGNRQKKIYQAGRCRKLMPIEYERLQNLPDNYTVGVADSRRYTAIGNGWTVDVIAHILKGVSERREENKK
jgi:DNA (cytosine-5)-methyltransferase 3A